MSEKINKKQFNQKLTAPFAVPFMIEQRDEVVDEVVAEAGQK